MNLVDQRRGEGKERVPVFPNSPFCILQDMAPLHYNFLYKPI